MTQKSDSTLLTRRKLLAGLGVGGFLATGAGLGTGSLGGRPPYARYTYAATPGDTDDRRVRVAWYETYNGELLETQNGTGETNATRVLDPATQPAYVEDATGPVVSLTNVMPGDSGSLAVGLQVNEFEFEQPSPVEIWLAFSVTENLENGVNEPESKAAGEDDPEGASSGDAGGVGTGELADAIEAEFWLDDGVLGFGACDGSRGIDEPVLGDGSLGDIGAELADGVKLAGCLEPGERRCLGLAWWLPEGVANAVQSDSVRFDLTVVGQPCESGNPFAEVQE